MEKLTLDMMERCEYTFSSHYVTRDEVRYTYRFKSGHKLVVSMSFGDLPFGVTLYAPNGQHGEEWDFATPEEALDSFNRAMEEGRVGKNFGRIY